MTYHILHHESYPSSDSPRKLYAVPYGLKVFVEINRDASSDTATVTVHAPLYDNKMFLLGVSYRSSQFTDQAILKDSDFIKRMSRRFRD